MTTAMDPDPGRRRVVLYAVGSPLVIDAEESCARAGIEIVAGVRNVDGAAYVSDSVRVMARDELTAAERACGFIVALFTPGHRRAAVDDALRAGFGRGATLADPTAIVARSAVIGGGVFINAGCVIAGACRLGDWVLINRSASIGHHASIGDYASVGPGAVLAGNVTLGRGAVIGAGAVILPQVDIGDNAVIAAGAVVRRNVAAGTLVEGNPARVAKSGIGGYRGIAV